MYEIQIRHDASTRRALVDIDVPLARRIGGADGVPRTTQFWIVFLVPVRPNRMDRRSKYRACVWIGRTGSRFISVGTRGIQRASRREKELSRGGHHEIYTRWDAARAVSLLCWGYWAPGGIRPTHRPDANIERWKRGIAKSLSQQIGAVSATPRRRTRRPSSSSAIRRAPFVEDGSFSSVSSRLRRELACALGMASETSRSMRPSAQGLPIAVRAKADGRAVCRLWRRCVHAA